MNERIKQLRKHLNLNQKEFSARIGVQQSTMSYIEKKGSTITEQNIKAICNEFKVNEDWLRTGKGKMLNDDLKWQEFKLIFDNLRPELQDYIIKTATDLLHTQNQMQESNFSDIKKRAETLSELYQRLPVSIHK